jgi:hypothetical protein
MFAIDRWDGAGRICRGVRELGTRVEEFEKFGPLG